MADPVLCLNFFGARLSVAADSPRWLDRMRQAFAAFVGDEPRPGDFFLTISDSAGQGEPPDLALTWEGILPDGRPGRVWESAFTAVLAVEESVVVKIEHTEGSATAHVMAGGDAALFSSALMFILDAALLAAGQQLVHGACLVDQRSQRAALICVPSGGGKTTTSMAMARDGFSLMTDDASVLIPNAGRPLVWGLPRPLKVHRYTADLLSWIGPLPDTWDENGEQGIPLARIADRISVMAPQPVELGAVFLLGPRSSGDHAVTRLPKPEMLIAIAHDNVAFRAAGMTPRALRRFGELGGMVADVPTFQISAGRELASLPAMVAAAMNEDVLASRIP
ncbi:hypothetical protein DFR52_103100 [Hoeflea marina]|uniref:Hpr(Ser) kinase/phosphatase n=1 Tax=Hoeflea marina TaxID=274592 RepID=A0A317PHJ9_9HYPH|nr:hypothetical protein [Hoeflea marina]PWV99901.1 hypothetical protein DFR52_103100 [Hoeflea marina]